MTESVRILLAAVIVLFAPPITLAVKPVFTTLYNFAGAAPGASPLWLIEGPGGVLYGATYTGIFSLTPPTSPGGEWTETALHTFPSKKHLTIPYAQAVIGPNGILYGGTAQEGPYYSGLIYALQPPASAGQPWTEKVLYTFTGGADGGFPNSPLTLTGDGTLYGATAYGGANGVGVVFALRPPAAPGGSWTEQVLYNYQQGSGGDEIGVTYSSGVFYGWEWNGFPVAPGFIFSLTPPVSGEGLWTANTLYNFNANSPGFSPASRLVVSSDGVLCGTTNYGTANSGTAFSLAPPVMPGQPWILTTLYAFSPVTGFGASLLLHHGNLLGTSVEGGYQGNGSIFALKSPGTPGGSWTLTALHYFSQGRGTNDYPRGGLVPGSGGVYYGLTFGGGTYYDGTVYSFEP